MPNANLMQSLRQKQMDALVVKYLDNIRIPQLNPHDFLCRPALFVQTELLVQIQLAERSPFREVYQLPILASVTE
jgi:hypothetical protein